jgi:hypothetical protein
MKQKTMSERTFNRRCKSAAELLRSINAPKFTGRAPRTRAALAATVKLLDGIIGKGGTRNA